MSKSIASWFTVVRVIVMVGVVVLVASAIGWWRLVYSSPSNVFDRMLANSLSSPSVTKVVTQADESQNLNQTSALVTEPQQIVLARSVLGQTLDPDTTVTTESIGTPTTDFVRYTDIKTSQKNASGKAFDFSSVIGLWGKSDQNDPNGSDAQLFNQTVLGVVPVANVRQPLRAALLEEIKTNSVYKIDTGSVKRQLVNGRPVYTYDVTIVPVAYVTMLKNFARALGITQLEQVDPSQYENSAPLKFILDVDVWSGQLKKVAYGGSERTELYSAYGARSQIDLPATSIGVDELQTRLQQIQ